MNRQEYLLTCIAEEASEVIKETSKINRFGARTKHRDNEIPITRMLREFLEFCSLMDIYFEEFVDETDFPVDDINVQRREKFERYWAAHNRASRVQ